METFFKPELNTVSGTAVKTKGVWTNPLGEVSSETNKNVSEALPTIKLTSVYDTISEDAKLKRDEMVNESEVRLTPELTVQDKLYPFTHNGLLSLNDFTNIPTAMLEYLIGNNLKIDYSIYANDELDARAKKPRVSKQFLLRLREIASTDTIRGVMSSRYGIIDHTQVMDAVMASIPAGWSDCECATFHYDSDSLSMNVITPDYIKDDQGSEYSCGFFVSNSEIRDRTYSVRPYIHRAIDRSGYIWGKRELAFKCQMKHFGKIDFDKIQNLTELGIESSLTMGKNFIKLLDYARAIPVDNGLRVIATLARDQKITVSQAQRWHGCYLQNAYRGTAFGIVNSLSQASQYFSGSVQEMMETIATSILANKIDTSEDQIKKRWESIISKSHLLSAETVKQYEHFTV